MTWLPFSESVLLPDILKSFILLTIILIARLVLVRTISRSGALTVETKRRWVLIIRNWVAAVFIVGLIFIWAHELSTFAVSLVAIAVALVFHAMIIIYEEPKLARLFGSSYDAYRARVPRWIPRRPSA